MKYPISSKYRTSASIWDNDVDDIIKHFSSIQNPTTFLDFGCHFGHLSVEIALRFPVTVYSVDVFRAYTGNPAIEQTILELTGGKEFYDKFLENIAENKASYKGVIIPARVEDFFPITVDLDFCYTDATHNDAEVEYMKKIAERIKINGIFGGHDYQAPPIKDMTEALIASKQFELIEVHYGSWFLKKVA